ncbi:hypothetical protein BASA81_001434 [Batrachochytrium salamandrivorans]|nr:hypothetical protein BASA81_001434 [Batrachochytrium salamandrivorans]
MNPKQALVLSLALTVLLHRRGRREFLRYFFALLAFTLMVNLSRQLRIRRLLEQVGSKFAAKGKVESVARSLQQARKASLSKFALPQPNATKVDGNNTLGAAAVALTMADTANRLQQTAQHQLQKSLKDLELFPGSQNYFKSVAQAIDENFSTDTEMLEMWAPMTWQEIITTVYYVSKYREMRKARGDIPTPLPAMPPRGKPALTSRDVADWAFFANAAYEENDLALRVLLESRRHQLVFHEYHVGLFQPAHFLSMSLDQDLVVIGIKGTSSLSDWLTNLFIAKEELNIRSTPGFDSGIHAGVLHAARFVLDRVGLLLQKAFYKSGFRVVVVGHSLGAGVASALAMLLREELKMDRVTCYAFAPPPSVSKDLAMLSQEYVYSVVNGDDVIPRTGVAQLKNLAMGIRHTSDFVKQQGGDWKQVESTMDVQSWSELMLKHNYGFVEKKFDTYIPGRILYLNDNATAVEVSCDLNMLRVALVSSTMVSDHSMDVYAAKLGATTKTGM